MATVTVRFILEQDEGAPAFPSTAKARFQAALASGAIVSYTKTPIVDPAEMVAGKTRSNVVIVYRSAEDQETYIMAAQTDAELQAYMTSINTTRLNLNIS